MTKAFTLLLFLVWTVSANAQWANKPSNLTTIFDCPWSDNSCGIIDGFPGQYTVYESPNFGGNPLSAPRAMKTFMSANSAQGNGTWIKYLGNAREVYVGTWWAPNATFEGYQNNTNKMIFVRSPNSGDNSFLAWRGLPGINVSKQIMWYQQGSVDNCHISNFSGTSGGYCYNAVGNLHDGTGTFYPNVNGSVANIYPGSGWHKLEFYLKASSGYASKDGVVKIWIDGVLSTSNTNINISPGGFEEFQINHAWDGTSCTSQGRICGYEWAHYWDHTVIAVGGGTGAVPVQPAQPALAKPTNLKIL